MGRHQGSKNKQKSVPWPMNLSTNKRIDLLANIIVDKIIEDQKNGSPLLKKIEAEQKLSKSSNQK